MKRCEKGDILILKSARPEKFDYLMTWFKRSIQNQENVKLVIPIKGDVAKFSGYGFSRILFDRDRFEPEYASKFREENRFHSLNCVYIPVMNQHFKAYENVILFVLGLRAKKIILWFSPERNISLSPLMAKIFVRSNIVRKGFVWLHDALNRTKLFLYKMFELLISLPVLCLATLKFISMVPSFIRSDRVILMNSYGFGHTITGPDCARRLFRGEKIVFLIFQRDYHNSKVSRLFRDIQVAFLPFVLKFSKNKNYMVPFFIREKMTRLYQCFLKYLVKNIMTIDELYKMVRQQKNVSRHLKHYQQNYPGNVVQGYFFVSGWSELVEKVKVPEVCFSKKIKKLIKDKMNSHYKIRKTKNEEKICCLYLRDKGDQKDIYSSSRSGSGLKVYRTALKYLIQKGFIVLIVGDVNVAEEELKEFEGAVMTAELINCDSTLFSLYAGTSCDFWIGNAGGAFTLPAVNKIPSLVIDAFPYASSSPNAWYFYKKLMDVNGEVISYDKIFREHCFQVDFKDWKIVHATEVEIERTIRLFIEEFSRKEHEALSEEVLESLPNYVLAKHTGTTLAPSWLELFRDQKSVVSEKPYTREKKVFYVECSPPFWIPFARRMEKEKGWKPVYWISGPNIHSDIYKNFSDVIVQSTFDAHKNIPPEEYRFQPLEEVSPSLKEFFVNYKNTILKMMDRMDAERSFNLEQRETLYSGLIRYWDHVIQEHSPEVVIFPIAPHMVFDYVIYLICQYYQIEIILFDRCAVEGYILQINSIENSSDELAITYNRLLQNSNTALDLVNRDFINHVKKIRESSYEKAMPFYLKERLALDSHLDINKRRKIRQVPDNYLKFEGYELDAQIPVRVYKRMVRKAAQFKKVLRDRYDRLTTAVDYGKDYVLFPLHYQPERSTSPLGGDFVDQLKVIELLSKCLPSEWLLIVKEHRLQFSSTKDGDRGRDHDYYEKILKFSKVHLAPLDEEPFELMGHAKAVATISGSPGWEAVNRGVPVLVFGFVWYRFCEGVFDVSNQEKLTEVMQKISSGYQVDMKKVDLFIKALEEVSFKSFEDWNFQRAAGLTDEENAAAIITQLHKKKSVFRNNKLVGI